MIKVKNIEISESEVLLLTNRGRGRFAFSHSNILSNATREQILKYTLSPFGIHWTELDEDLCFDGFGFDFPKNDVVRYLG
ncbi:MAG: DUF2442 domain-containing protein [Bacteroidales bacterium]|jgi:hypothetical protein|nr:DUF2442 domain-containing protein [Bacteroidales bacterium]